MNKNNKKIDKEKLLKSLVNFSDFIYNNVKKENIIFKNLKDYEILYLKVYRYLNKLLQENQNINIYFKYLRDIQKSFYGIFQEFNTTILHDIKEDIDSYSYFKPKETVELYPIFSEEKNGMNIVYEKKSDNKNESNNANKNEINEGELSIDLNEHFFSKGGMFL